MEESCSKAKVMHDESAQTLAGLLNNKFVYSQFEQAALLVKTITDQVRVAHDCEKQLSELTLSINLTKKAEETKFAKLEKTIATALANFKLNIKEEPKAVEQPAPAPQPAPVYPVGGYPTPTYQPVYGGYTSVYQPSYPVYPQYQPTSPAYNDSPKYPTTTLPKVPESTFSRPSVGITSQRLIQTILTTILQNGHLMSNIRRYLDYPKRQNCLSQDLAKIPSNRLPSDAPNSNLFNIDEWRRSKPTEYLKLNRLDQIFILTTNLKKDSQSVNNSQRPPSILKDVNIVECLMASFAR